MQTGQQEDMNVEPASFSTPYATTVSLSKRREIRPVRVHVSRSLSHYTCRSRAGDVTDRPSYRTIRLLLTMNGEGISGSVSGSQTAGGPMPPTRLLTGLRRPA
jgi:hypothetical protein